MARTVPWVIARKGAVVFDTNVLIEAFTSEARVHGRNLVDEVRKRGRRTVVTCAYEFLRREDGQPLGGSLFEARRDWLRERAVLILPFVDAAHDPLERLALRHEGSLTLADAHIAAACIGVELPLVTYNVRDFEPIEGLSLVDLL